MSKPKIARPRATKPELTLTLADLSITWTPPRRFEGPDPKPITISGATLGRFLSWLERTAPGWLDESGQPEEFVNLPLQGLAEILGALGETDHSERDAGAMFYALEELARNSVARLESSRETAKYATVTVHRAAEPKAAAS